MDGSTLGAAIALMKKNKPTDAQVESAVSDWLDDHPEATTTVQDGSITKAKLDSNLQGTVDDVSDLKNEIDDFTGVDITASLEWTNQSVISGVHGSTTWNGSCKTSSLYDVSGISAIKFYAINTKSGSTRATAAFYKSDNSAILPCIQRAGETDGYGFIEVLVPEDAKYIRFSKFITESDVSFRAFAVRKSTDYEPYAQILENKNSIAQTAEQIDSLEEDVQAVDERVDSAEETIDVLEDKTSYILVDKGFEQEDQTYSGFTEYAGYTIAGNGTITTQYGSSYTAFQMVADRDFDLYFSRSSYAPQGGTCLLGVNGTRYLASSSNLPTSENPVHVAKGATVNIAVYTTVKTFVFFWNNVGFVVNPELIEEINDVINKQIICSVSDANHIDIYIPSRRNGSSYYFDIKLAHAVNESANCDVWRLDAGYLVQKSGNTFINSVNILSGGEWTCALKIKDASDFMGGAYHGDEIMNNAVILVDGTPHTFTAGEELTCSSVSILENTNLYNPDVENELAAVVAREIIITVDEIKTRQRVTWKHAYTMDWSYLGMFCVMRSVSDRGYSNVEFIPYDISEQGFNNPMYVNNTDCAKNRKLIGEYGTESKLHFELECTHINPELPTRPTYIYNGDPYNKIYMSFCPNNYDVSVGDVWEATHVYRISENKSS